MQPQIPPTPIPPSNSEVIYQVMPEAGGHSSPTSSGPLPSAAPLPGATHAMPVDSGLPFYKSTKFYVIVAVLAALILGGAGWYLFGTNSDEQNTPVEEDTKLPSVWLKQYFDKTSCDDKSICGDGSDPDSDGLNNYDEFIEGTSPVNPDADGDGLADGDEKHVYKTDPTLKYTDRRPEVASNNWTDSVQIKNGYDPNISAARLSDARLKQIADDTVKFGLHEPTKTTMGVQSSSGTPPVATNCGTVVGTHLSIEPTKLTAQEDASLKCADDAIIKCAPSKIHFDYTADADSPDIGDSDFAVVAKNSDTCTVTMKYEKPSADAVNRTCNVPLSFLSEFTAAAKAANSKSGTITVAISIATVQGEVTHSVTGVKTSLNCT